MEGRIFELPHIWRGRSSNAMAFKWRSPSQTVSLKRSNHPFVYHIQLSILSTRLTDFNFLLLVIVVINVTTNIACVVWYNGMQLSFNSTLHKCYLKIQSYQLFTAIMTSKWQSTCNKKSWLHHSNFIKRSKKWGENKLFPKHISTWIIRPKYFPRPN